MRSVGLSLLVVALTVLSAAVAEAQPRGHRRRGPQVGVTGFSPTSGPPGTRVTITGHGFTPATQIRVGMRPVRAESITPEAITLTIPRRSRGYDIQLHHPGAPPMVVGTFTIAFDPTVAGVTAGTHRAGTQITISGSNFAAGDQPSLNGMNLPVVRLTPTTIVARIPPGASTGRLMLTRPSTGASWDTGVVVEVAAPPPVLQSIAPTSGAPGTRVRLTVANLGPDDVVYFGPVALARAGAGRSWIDVVIPPNARRGDVLSVRGPRGDSAGQRFEVTLAPAIASVVARGVPQGVEVTVTGTGFGPDARVTVGSTAGRITARGPGRLVVLFPPTTPVGSPVVVQSGGQSAASPQPLGAYRR